jgi:hypothetical protein
LQLPRHAQQHTQALYDVRLRAAQDARAMPLPELRMSFADRAALRAEANQSLRCGRAFLSERAAIEVLSDCVLVLVHPEHGAELRLSAQVVMVNEHGTGLALSGLGAEQLSALDTFIVSAPEPANDVPLTQPPTRGAADAQGLAGASEAEVLDEELAETLDFPRSEETELSPPDTPDTLDNQPDEPAAESGRPSGSTELQTENRQERLRHLSPAEQLKVARRGELPDRLAVERLYGKQVWEALLQNPRITVPEVAKIARKGTVPKPLIEQILDNAAWVKADAVRRALLSNPKVSSDALLKLLRATPKHELKLIEKGTSYGAAVREAARKLLRQP